MADEVKSHEVTEQQQQNAINNHRRQKNAHPWKTGQHQVASARDGRLGAPNFASNAMVEVGSPVCNAFL